MNHRETKFQAMFKCMDTGRKVWITIGVNERYDQPGWAQVSPWVQLTGLLDKNGKEIYEGDVIVADAYPFFSDGVPGYVGVVEWAYGAWYYDLQCVNKNLVGSAVGDQLGADGNEVTRFRIIGNIYENPELTP